MTADPVLRLVDLAFDYGPRPILRELDLSVGRGEVVCILGPSGSGKSTLLRLIAGLERPSSGRVEIAGRCVADARSSEPAERRGVGMVFQDDALFPHLSVIDNVEFGLMGLPRLERRTRALEALDRLGLSDRADDWPQRLSGGEHQRVAVICRCGATCWAAPLPAAAAEVATGSGGGLGTCLAPRSCGLTVVRS